MDTLLDRALGALTGAAVGDALGGAAEGNSPADIQARYGGYIDRHRPAVQRGLAQRPADRAVPQGRRAHHRRHVDDARPRRRVRRGRRPPRRLRHRRASRAAAHRRTPVDPRVGDEALLLHRIFLAEKWLVARLHYGHVDPREAGVGNIVNCGAAMYMTPVGIVNAADPGRRLRRGDRHRRRPPVELRPRGRRRVRRGGRRGDATRGDDRVGRRHRPRRRPRRHEGGDRGRRRRSPPSTTTGATPSGHCARRSPRSTPSARTIANRRWTPADRAARSRSRSCRSPSASPSWRAATTARRCSAAVNYGRDSDSIATMAGAITGALGGADAVPHGLARARCRRRAGSTSSPRRRHWSTWPRDIWRARRRTGRGPRRRRASLAHDDPADVGAARGPRRPRPRRQAPRRRATSTSIADRWVAAGGSLDAPHSGATPEPATPTQRALARAAARRARRRAASRGAARRRARRPRGDRARWRPGGSRHAARRRSRPIGCTAAGSGGRPGACSASRSRRSPGDGIRAIAESTGNWPLSGYFTAIGLDPDVAAAYPWNRASRTTSLVENIAGMPEDDDLNFALLALTPRRAARRRR